MNGKIIDTICYIFKLLPYRGRYQDELPETLSARKYLEHSELVKLMTWKLTVSIDYIYPYPGLCTKCLQSDFCKVSVLNYLAPFLCDPRCDRRLMSEVEGQLGANGGFRVSVQLQY